MNLRTVGLAVLLAVGGGAICSAPAHADHYDRYYGARYYRGRDSEEIRRRDILRSRMIDLGDRTRLAEREGDLSRRDAERVYEKLDDVRDFLRHDRYLEHDEFRRRMRDLDEAEDRFRRSCRHRRYEDRYRYDGRYRYEDRYEDRYYERH